MALTVGWLFLVGTGSVAYGQTPLPKTITASGLEAAGPSGSASAPGPSAKSLESRLTEARADLAAAIALDQATLTNQASRASPQEVSLRRAMLQRLVRIYEKQLGDAAELQAAIERKSELARQVQAGTGFAQPRPYSILVADGLHEEIQTEQLNLDNTESALKLFDQVIDENRDALARAEENLRRINEQLEGAKDPAAVGRFSWQREMESLRSQVAAASMAAWDTERKIRQERLAGSRIRLGWLQRQLVAAEAGTKFTQADLDGVVERLEAQSRELEQEFAGAETGHAAALRALEAAREQLRQAQPAAAARHPEMNRLTELAELRQTQVESASGAVQILRLMLEAVNTERTMWELRYAAYDSRSVETLHQSEQRLQEFIRRLALWRDYYQQQIQLSDSRIAVEETRLQSLNRASDLAPLVRERLAGLRERDQLLLRIYRQIERLARLAQRWDEGLKDAAGHLPLTGRVRSLFSDTRSFFGKLWTFELFTAEDAITVDGQRITGKRSVTVGKVVMAILILVVGYWVSDLISRWVEPLIVKRFKIERNQANLIRRWLRALLVVGLVVFSLVSVKIPLTIFAFAGGALAIGLGFGTQTLLKNFVSGILILFERPFQVGDVLDVAGQKGTVTGIGLRSSVLQLWDGTETLIPNSSFLENNVNNWTYSSRAVRFVITVGVAYGSDTRRVIQLLGEVVERHGLVEKDPKPQVLFTDFGDSALSFELRFWVDVLRSNAAQVASDLRLMIAGAFTEHGITIAFPQREVSLNASRPIQVQVVPSADQHLENSPANLKT